MEKKKRWLINFLYYGIIFSIGCLIVYILFKKCLIVVLSYLSAILLKPFIDLILEKLHIKNKVFSIIMTIIIFILLYTCFFLFVFFSCLFFIKTLSFLPSFIETVYQELLSHQYLISLIMEIYKKRTAANRSSLIPSASPFATISHFFFYAILSTNSNSHSKYSFNKYSLCIIACDEYGSFYCLSVYSFLSNNTFFISSITYSKKKRKSLYDPYIFYRDVYYHYKNI